MRQSRALKVLVHAKLLLKLAALLVCDGVLVLGLHSSNKVRVIAEIELGPDKHNRHSGAVVAHFRIPLSRPSHVFTEQNSAQTLDFTFSYDVVLTSEKHTRKTSVCGYDRGRRRS